MMIESVSGIVVRFNPHKMPVTNVLRETLNSLAGEEVFPVNHGEITWVNELTKTKKLARTPRKSTQGLQTHRGDGGRAKDMLLDLPIDESTCFEGSSPREQIRMSYNQEDIRIHRNLTKKTIPVGKKSLGVIVRINPYKNWECSEHYGMQRETKTVWTSHDSHGKHGRKPRYKDRSKTNSSW